MSRLLSIYQEIPNEIDVVDPDSGDVLTTIHATTEFKWVAANKMLRDHQSFEVTVHRLLSAGLRKLPKYRREDA